ncbi:MAG: 50S ribosomal protein L4, partial [Chitinophagaceae bacterium]
MQIEVLNKDGKKTGRQVALPEEIFGIEPNDHVIYLAVKQHLAARRQGTHKVKTRAEVKGASRKLHRQKGTGGSRKGNIRNPLYKGGGTIFGPKPHGYD